MTYEEKQLIEKGVKALEQIANEFVKYNKRMARIEYKMTYGDEDVSKLEDKDGNIKNLPEAYQ